MSRRDLALCLLVVILWAGNIISIKIGVTELPPLAFLALRFLFTSILFLPFLKWPGWKNARIVFEIAFFMSVMCQGLLFVGMHYVPAATSVILIQVQVIFSVLLGMILFKESVGWRTWSGIALGLGGISLIVGGPDFNAPIWATILILSSAFFVAFAYIRMKALQDIHSPTYIALLNVFALPFIIPASMLTEMSAWSGIPQANWTLAGPVLLYQVLLVSFSHILWQRLIARNPVSKVTPYTLLMPVFGVAFSALILKENITLIMLLGGAMTLAGVAIITFRRIQKGITPQPEVTE